MERWKDLNPAPNILNVAEQLTNGFNGPSAIDTNQLQLVGVTDLALIQRQLQQQQPSSFATAQINQDKASAFPRPQPVGLGGSLAYKGPALPAANISTSASTTNFSDCSYAGSVPTSPTLPRLHDLDTPFKNGLTTNPKKQKLLHFSPGVYVRFDSSPASTYIQLGPHPSIPRQLFSMLRQMKLTGSIR